MIELTFDEVFTFETLYKAHLRARHHKRDKRPVVRFELGLLSNLYELYARLKSGKYKVSSYTRFSVFVPRKREIQTLRYCDRVVQHVLCDSVLDPYFNRRVIMDNCVGQKGKGTHFALKRFEERLRAFTKKHGANGYFLKCDIKKYFPSIPHDKLKSVFLPLIADEKLRSLTEGIIDSFHTDINFLTANGIKPLTDDPKFTGRGMPIGNQTSQVFGMYYLDPVDRFVKEKLRVKIYSRYMDDFILVHHSKRELQQILLKLRALVTSLGLSFNEKTQIIPLKEGAVFLGFKYYVTPEGRVIKLVKKETRKRLKSRARLLKKACIEGIIKPERVRVSLAAFHGHLKYCKGYKLESEIYSKLAVYASEGGVIGREYATK